MIAPIEERHPYYICVTTPAEGDDEWLWKRLATHAGLDAEGESVRTFGPVYISLQQKSVLESAMFLTTLRKLYGRRVKRIECVEVE